MLRAAGDGAALDTLATEIAEAIEEFSFAITKLEEANDHPQTPHVGGYGCMRSRTAATKCWASTSTRRRLRS